MEDNRVNIFASSKDLGERPLNVTIQLFAFLSAID